MSKRAWTVALTLTLTACGNSNTPTTPSSTTTFAFSDGTIPVDSIWRAQSTVVGVSPTLNSCPTDNAVGQTRSVEWGVKEGSFKNQVSILLYESAGVYDPQHPPDYMSDPRTPLYFGSRTGDQFAAMAEQDGGRTCFVNHGDLTGTFSPDGLSFDAVENIKYYQPGEGDMVVSRHWTGTRR